MPLPAKKVLIIGGGISGLALGWFLSQKGKFSVEIFEAGENPGGSIQTKKVNDYLVEEGPNGFLVNQARVWNLIHDLGIQDELLPGSPIAGKNRYILKGGKLRILPSSLVGFLFNSVLSPWGRMRVLLEPFASRPKSSNDESIEEFSLRRLGKEATDTLLDPFVSGIHAGTPSRLSASSAFPRLKGLETRFGSIFLGLLRGGLSAPPMNSTTKNPKLSRIWSLRQGLGQLITALSSKIEHLHLNCPVSQVTCDKGTGEPGKSWEITTPQGTRRGDYLVFATNPNLASKLLSTVDSEGQQAMGAMNCTSIAVVAMGFHQNQVAHPLNGFGYLIPSSEKRPHLGVQWCSTIYPGRAPDGKVLIRVLLGGTQRPDIPAWDISRIEKVALEEIRKDLGITGNPEMVHSRIWNPAIPQYELGHSELVARLKNIESRWRSLFFTGNSMEGVSLNDCVAQASDCASRIEQASLA